MNYPRPAITVDVIVYDRTSNRILLIKRKKDPYKDFWANPGGFFNPEDFNGEKRDQSLESAARRELKEETGIDVNSGKINFSLTLLTLMDKPDRDPRQRTITPVYVLTLWDLENVNPVAADDAAECKWFSIKDLLDKKVPLAFDHLQEIHMFAWSLPNL